MLDVIINKRMIYIHGNSIEAETIQALHLIKDTIIYYRSLLEICSTKDLIDSVYKYISDMLHT